MEIRLKQKVTVVAGGAPGTGRVVAEGFAGEGAQLVVADIDASRGEAKIHAIRGEGGDALHVRGDVCKSTELDSTFIIVANHHSRVDSL